MAAFYDEMVEVTDDLLAELGQAGFVRRTPQSGPAHNPTAGTPVNHAATFAVIEYDNRDVDGSRILATDKRVIMGIGTLSIAPATSDLLIEADGGVYKIVTVRPLNPAGTPVAFDIQARR